MNKHHQHSRSVPSDICRVLPAVGSLVWHGYGLRIGDLRCLPALKLVALITLMAVADLSWLCQSSSAQYPPANRYMQAPGGVAQSPPPYTPPAAYAPNSYAPEAYNPNIPYSQPQYAPAPTSAPPAYIPPGYAPPAYSQPGYGSAGANQANAPFVNNQSSGVQINNSSALPAPSNSYGQPPTYGAAGYGSPGNPGVPTPPPAIGYGAPGTYVPDSVSAYQLAPGVTASIDPQGGTASAIAPGVVPPGGLGGEPTLGFSTPTPYQPRIREAPIRVYAQEARTGRVVLGGSVNSDLGLAGQVIIDERNFDWLRWPTSFADLFGGRAFRGAGQNFRAELMPGTNVQRYTVNFTQPHLFGYSRIGFSVGGFLFTRQFRDWTEQRLGGRLALSYDINQDLSLTTELQMQDVKIFDPRLAGQPALDRVLGSNDLYTLRMRLAHDTRDNPFMATEGHLIELIYDQVFGEFDYPRGQVNVSRYFLLRQRADGGGRHTLATSWKAGITGSDTPLFENFFAGGYSTLRGFSFRGASPKEGDLQVGGRTMFLGSLEYLFPLTADDMLRGILFVDYGALSKDLNVAWDDYRIAPGFGVRVNVPALGPAPLAFDFAFPVKHDDNDDRQVFSFFMGFTR
ncbi:MAG: BamA/TamA family outer membrane protein [Pirellulaceae bacterium]|nr:BamA/TamA family outer membrane protein [Pirellulaceae bacterium]